MVIADRVQDAEAVLQEREPTAASARNYTLEASAPLVRGRCASW
jgi:hypothetical protein